MTMQGSRNWSLSPRTGPGAAGGYGRPGTADGGSPGNCGAARCRRQSPSGSRLREGHRDTKTDTLDAPGHDFADGSRTARAETQVLASLVARRHQVVAMLVSEKNRLRRAISAVRPRVEAHIAWLEQELEDLDQGLRQTLPESSVAKRMADRSGRGGAAGPAGTGHAGEPAGRRPSNRDSGTLRTVGADAPGSAPSCTWGRWPNTTQSSGDFYRRLLAAGKPEAGPLHAQAARYPQLSSIAQARSNSEGRRTIKTVAFSWYPRLDPEPPATAQRCGPRAKHCTFAISDRKSG